ncbi:unnamed protein product, partial [Laminaria digitata]
MLSLKPWCDGVCVCSAEDQPEDVMIANIARTCFPELSLNRLREVEAEHDTFMAVLPIFYCEFCFVFFRWKKIPACFKVYSYCFPHDAASRWNLSKSECEFLSDGRVLLVAKLASRHTVVDHFVEDGTQGLHYCRLEPRHDDRPADASESFKLEILHQQTRALATRVVEP